MISPYDLALFLVENDEIDNFVQSAKIRLSGWCGPTRARSDEPEGGGYWETITTEPEWVADVIAQVAEVDENEHTRIMEMIGLYEGPEPDYE